MKKYFATSAIFLFFGFATLAQESYNPFTQYGVTSVSKDSVNTKRVMNYGVRGRYDRPVKKEEATNAKLLRDLIFGYPVNWITNYVSVELTAPKGDKLIRTLSTNEKLTPEQKDLLKSIDIGSNIAIHVKYTYNHPLTHAIENYEINTSVTVVPDKEAEYHGGYENLKKYLYENCISKVSATISQRYQRGTVVFTLNENGEPTGTRIAKSSGDVKMDKLLLDAINKMPKWSPAENANGEKVNQDFEFTLNENGDGC